MTVCIVVLVTGDTRDVLRLDLRLLFRPEDGRTIAHGMKSGCVIYEVPTVEVRRESLPEFETRAANSPDDWLVATAMLGPKFSFDGIKWADDPLLPWAVLAGVGSFHTEGREAARRALPEAMRRFPENGALWAALARLDLMEHHFDAARANLRLALTKQPWSSGEQVAKTRLTSLLVQLGLPRHDALNRAEFLGWGLPYGSDYEALLAPEAVPDDAHLAEVAKLVLDVRRVHVDPPHSPPLSGDIVDPLYDRMKRNPAFNCDLARGSDKREILARCLSGHLPAALLSELLSSPSPPSRNPAAPGDERWKELAAAERSFILQFLSLTIVLAALIAGLPAIVSGAPIKGWTALLCAAASGWIIWHFWACFPGGPRGLMSIDPGEPTWHQYFRDYVLYEWHVWQTLFWTTVLAFVWRYASRSRIGIAVALFLLSVIVGDTALFAHEAGIARRTRDDREAARYARLAGGTGGTEGEDVTRSAPPAQLAGKRRA